MQIKTSNPTKPLTPRQLQLLTMVAAFQNSRCYSPTMAEIAAELRISRSTAFEHIAELRRKKLLSASSGRARSLTITSKAQELLNRRTTCPPAPLSQQPAAGIPLPYQSTLFLPAPTPSPSRSPATVWLVPASSTATT
ncbi:MAG: LexA family protein [Planctomycetota bacterium]